MLRFPHLRLSASVVLLLLLCLQCDDTIPENEIQCEQAVARLESCCGRSVAASCKKKVSRYGAPDYWGCQQPIYDYPDFSESQSLCIWQKSCEDIVNSGLCAANLTDVNQCKSSLSGDMMSPSQACELIKKIGCY